MDLTKLETFLLFRESAKKQMLQHLFLFQDLLSKEKSAELSIKVIASQFNTI